MSGPQGRSHRRRRPGSTGPLVWAAVGVFVVAGAVVAYVATRPAAPAVEGAGAEEDAPADERAPGARGPSDDRTKRPVRDDDASRTDVGDARPAEPEPMTLTPDDFILISGPTSPRVAYALRRTDARLDLVLDVATFSPDGTGASVELGLAVGRKVLLSDKEARYQRTQGAVRLSFSVPAAELVEAPEDWKKLRMGVAVHWEGGPAGTHRLRERFLHTDSRAPHAGLSLDPGAWAPLAPDEYETVVADRKRRIAVGFEQPMAGKVTIVIEDAEGRRVRNLASGVKMPAGPQQVEWDGLDDEGVLVKPGTYRWRSVHHRGIEPEYLFSFCNGGERFLLPFGSNHMHFTAAAASRVVSEKEAGKRYVFFAAPMTEGGHAMIAVDPGGAWKHGYNPIHGSGMNAVAVAADEKFLYAAHDGEAWGQHIDRQKTDWKATVHLTLSRFEIESGRLVDYPGGKRFAVIETHEHGPGSANPAVRNAMSLGGMAMIEDKLYVASRDSQAILVVDKSSAKTERKIALEAPGPLAARGGRLAAVSGTAVVRVDPESGKTRPVLRSGRLEPRGIALDEKGRIYVSDGRTHTVKVFGEAGRPLRSFGEAGGPYEGRYVPGRMIRPTGLALAGGRLWVAEDRRNPKRALAWDLASRKVVVEKFGNPPYGGPGAGFDTRDHTRWIGHRALWELDFGAKSATCKAVLQKEAGHIGGRIGWRTHYRFLHVEGRTLLSGFGGTTFVSELAPDGSVRDLAFIASTHRFCFDCGWNPPEEFVEAFNGAYPGRKGKHADKGPGVLWVDLNGDGLCQADEFDFSTECQDFAGAYWGHDSTDLTLRVPAKVGGKAVIVTLEPRGFHPKGAPRYPGLNDACAAGVPVELGWTQVETATDRFGNMIANSDPVMKCFAGGAGEEGRLLWTYPNRWVGVHGSHKAPLPEVGVLQGALFFLGMAPFDDEADVFVMNGNHGRFFVMTSDGFYLDEMFKDVRLGGSRDVMWIGGEAFGGFFAKSEKDGEYYLQTGGDGYRVFRLHGLKEAVRSRGEVTVTPEQLVAADRRIVRRQAAEQAAKEASIRRSEKRIGIDGRDTDWPREVTLSWDKSGRFPVKVRCSYDDRNLYLYYDVRDASPWVNGGKDWTTLFKTGDSVDLQIGTDPGAGADRRGPVPGDCRLLIAPAGPATGGKPLAVLYRHRVPGAKNPVTFTCPWRSETVDVVRKLEGARVAVEKGGDWYHLEASVPLDELGLRDPAGRTFKADFGVIYGDPAGTVNVLRSYWSNQATMLVNDVPGEIMLHPNLWGSVRFEGR